MSAHRTLSQAAHEFMQLTDGHYRPNTIRNRQFVLARLVRSIGDIQVRHLKPQHMETHFYAKPNGLVYILAPRSVNLERSHITGFVRFMQNRGWLTSEPMLNVRATKVVQRERVRLSAGDLRHCMELAGHPRDRVFLALAINTGLRISEIQDMRIGDVNLDVGDIRVRITKSHLETVFPIARRLDVELRKWLAFYAERVTLTPSMYLVPAKTVPLPPALQIEAELRPDRPMGYPTRLMNRLFTQLGIDPRGEGVHTFRRSVARLYYDSLLASTGSRDDAVRMTQAFLHHSSLVTTEHYLGLTRERERMESSIRGKSFILDFDLEVEDGEWLEDVRGTGDDHGL